MQNIETPLRYTIDLETLSKDPLTPKTLLVKGDAEAHLIEARVTRQGASVDLTGASCTASLIHRGSGRTLLLPGSIRGDTASVRLTEAACAEAGRADLLVRLRLEGAVLTLLYLVLEVREGATDVLIDPEDIVPSLDRLLGEVARMEAATEGALASAERANESAEGADLAAETARDAALEALEAADEADQAALWTRTQGERAETVVDLAYDENAVARVQRNLELHAAQRDNPHQVRYQQAGASIAGNLVIDGGFEAMGEKELPEDSAQPGAFDLPRGEARRVYGLWYGEKDAEGAAFSRAVGEGGGEWGLTLRREDAGVGPAACALQQWVTQGDGEALAPGEYFFSGRVCLPAGGEVTLLVAGELEGAPHRVERAFPVSGGAWQRVCLPFVIPEGGSFRGAVGIRAALAPGEAIHLNSLQLTRDTDIPYAPRPRLEERLRTLSYYERISQESIVVGAGSPPATGLPVGIGAVVSPSLISMLIPCAPKAIREGKGTWRAYLYSRGATFHAGTAFPLSNAAIDGLLGNAVALRIGISGSQLAGAAGVVSAPPVMAGGATPNALYLEIGTDRRPTAIL